MRGKLINTEGIDGSGKTTAIDGLKLWSQRHYDGDIVFTKEPTRFRTGKWTYEVLTEPDTPPLMDFFAFCMDRRRHMEWIDWQLSNGKTVITDRYADSTRAYQTHRIAKATDMSMEETREWMETVFDPFRHPSIGGETREATPNGWNYEPDFTIYLDIPVDMALERAIGTDKYEEREQLAAAKDEYEYMYDTRENIITIDGTRQADVVRHRVVTAVDAFLNSAIDDPYARAEADN